MMATLAFNKLTIANQLTGFYMMTTLRVMS